MHDSQQKWNIQHNLTVSKYMIIQDTSKWGNIAKPINQYSFQNAKHLLHVYCFSKEVTEITQIGGKD